MDAQIRIARQPDIEIVPFYGGADEPEWLLIAPDGSQTKLASPIDCLINAVHGEITLADLKQTFEQRSGMQVSLEALKAFCIDLAKQGGVVLTDPSTTSAYGRDKRTPSLLQLHYHRDLLRPELLGWVARPLQIFFAPPLAVLMLVLVAAGHVLAYSHVGYPPDVGVEAVSVPLLYAILLVSFLLHELGHIAACLYFKCRHGALGVGLYFFSLVLYVNLTEVNRLPPRQKVVIDMGGLYLQLLCVPVCWLLFLVTQDLTYLMTIVIIDLTVIGNLQPMLRLDGFWAISDWAGIVNLHDQTGDVIRYLWNSLLHRLGRRVTLPSQPPWTSLKTSARRVLFGYVVFSIVIWPLFVISTVPMVVEAASTYPALWTTALREVVNGFQAGDPHLLLGQIEILFLPTLVLINLAFILKVTLDRRQMPSPMAGATRG